MSVPRADNVWGAHGCTIYDENAQAMGEVRDRNRAQTQELLMDRVRLRAKHQRSWSDLSKAMRMHILEKRYALDAVEKNNLQKMLDLLQECIEVNSRKTLVDRLESLSRQQGLKFMLDLENDVVFLSCETFYLEVCVCANGSVNDVKVHHDCIPDSPTCIELVNSVNSKDFADMAAQLEGFVSIYQLDAQQSVKKKAFIALQAMEMDISSLYEMREYADSLEHVLNNSLVGIVQNRRGGHPMKITYFIPPLDLVIDGNLLMPLSMQTFLQMPNAVGLSATLHLESSPANKLQIMPTVTVDPAGNPKFDALDIFNSTMLPATFVLRLNRPVPIDEDALTALGVHWGIDDSGIDINNPPKAEPIFDLVERVAKEQGYRNLQDKSYVNYYLKNEAQEYRVVHTDKVNAVMVSCISFTEAHQVTGIIKALKKYARFYTLLTSFIRRLPSPAPNIPRDLTRYCEVSIINFNHICITLMHPNKADLCSLEFVFRHDDLKAEIIRHTTKYNYLTEKITTCVRKTLSIPHTVRIAFLLWARELAQQELSDQGDNGGDSGLSMPAPSAAKPFIAPTAVPASANSAATGNAAGGAVYGNYGYAAGNSAATSSVPNYALTSEHLRALQHAQDIMQGAPSTSQVARNVMAANAETEETDLLPHNEELLDKLKQVFGDAKIELDEETKKSLKMQAKKKAADMEIIPLTEQADQVAVASSVVGVQQPVAAAAAATATASNITITPITLSGMGGPMTGGLRNWNIPGLPIPTTSSSVIATSKRSLDEGAIKEKKRKKKREDLAMGPPDKVYSRQNSPAAATADVTAASRKFTSPSSSPKGASGAGLIATAVSAPLSTRPSPKHSPVYSSPKHSTASNSPKSPYGTHSPKHGSSGKPSMSTLKSATVTSLSPKNEKSSSNPFLGPSTSAAAAAAGALKTREKEKISSSSIIIPSSVSAPVAMKPSMSNVGTSSSASSYGGASDAKGVTGAFGDISTEQLTKTEDVIVDEQAEEQYMIERSQEKGSLKFTLKHVRARSFLNTLANSSSLSSDSCSDNSSSDGSTTSDSSSKSKHRKHQYTGLKPGVKSGPKSKRYGETSISSLLAQIKPCRVGIKRSSSFGSISSAISTSSTTATLHALYKSSSVGMLYDDRPSTSAQARERLRLAAERERHERESAAANIAQARARAREKQLAEKERIKREAAAAVRANTSHPLTRSQQEYKECLVKLLRTCSTSGTITPQLEGFAKNIQQGFEEQTAVDNAAATKTCMPPPLTSPSLRLSRPASPTIPVQLEILGFTPPPPFALGSNESQKSTIASTSLRSSTIAARGKTPSPPKSPSSNEKPAAKKTSPTRTSSRSTVTTSTAPTTRSQLSHVAVITTTISSTTTTAGTANTAHSEQQKSKTTHSSQQHKK